MAFADFLDPFNLYHNPPSPTDKAAKYIGEIPGRVSPYFQPYFETGTQQLPQLSQEYGQLTADPSAMLNKIGAGYKQSPGFQFALNQALQGANRSAAAGGMAGSPSAQTESMDIASGLASKDFDRYMQDALNLYGKGLGGQSELAGFGLKAGTGLADNIAQVLSTLGSLQYAGGLGQQAAGQQRWQSLLPLLMTALG